MPFLLHRRAALAPHVLTDLSFRFLQPYTKRANEDKSRYETEKEAYESKAAKAKPAKKDESDEEEEEEEKAVAAADDSDDE